MRYLQKCRIDGCARIEKASRLCALHYERQRNGKPMNDPMRPFTFEETFWRKVGRQNQPHCWIWHGGKDQDGYGLLTHGKRTQRAARIMWELTFGAIPTEPKMFVCHRCDNPACVNPAHLFLGTGKDNSDDMMRKGRWAGSPTTKLSLATAKLIRSECSGSHGELRVIAKRYNVSVSTIHSIIKGRTWRGP